MKIIYIVPGFGAAYYCQNCIRNMDLAEILRLKGCDVQLVPMYMPLRFDMPIGPAVPLFYGAINVYLREKFRFIKHIPNKIQDLLNSKILLNWVSKKANSTDPRGHEEMTLSVMQGEKGKQVEELDKLVGWLKNIGKPDMVHLSNAMLIGLSKRIKTELNIPILCTLQDENTWIDKMQETYVNQAWEVLGERAQYVDTFIAVSQSYKDLIISKTNIPAEKIKVVHIGIPIKQYNSFTPSFDPPVIGYLSRISKELGFDILVEAFIKLRKKQYPDLKLRVTGGYSSEDKKFIKRQILKFKKLDILDSLEFVPDLYRKDLNQFFKGLTLVSVPVPGGEAFGIFQIESMLCGIPVVQPDAGAFYEIIKETKGGVIYKPNTPEVLAAIISNLLSNSTKLLSLGRSGQRSVQQKFNINVMADKLINIYRNLK